jgi:hypothetical protein
MSNRFVFFALLSACAGAPSEPTEPAEPEESSALHEQLVASIARDYKSMQLADDEFHWAPNLCRMPSPGGQHISKAAGAAHDGKLFVLYTADINRYGRAVGWLEKDWPDPRLRKIVVPPPGMLQVLVKESFVAKPLEGAYEGPYGNLHGAHEDGKPMVPGDPIGLFVMIELAGKPAGTDEGWIYGTVAPDGTVTSASDVGACHDCHRTRESRLFGLGTRPG